MPWRAMPGETPDPYFVWLSEVMLQQTTVAAVIPYFQRFLARFPTIQALAAAPVDDVMAAWAGLGYYARARNLHACARVVAASGHFPRDVAGLRGLPGVGAYTAAAIGSIAFGIPVVPVDGNVERVAARLFGVEAPLPGGRPLIAAAAARLGVDPDAQARSGDFTQALFDLGATVCTPRKPACALCPWLGACRARRSGDPERLPVKPVKSARPVRYGAHFWLENPHGQVLLRRRPPRGLLGGMLELPGTPWRQLPWSRDEAAHEAPQPADWTPVGTTRHVFTHFELVVDVYAAAVAAIVAAGLPTPIDALPGAGLSSAMRKCVALAAAFRSR